MRVQVLLECVPGVRREEIEQYAAAEAKSIADLIEAGWVCEAYYREDRHGAILMLECRSAAEAQQIVGTLPFVKAKFVKADLVPLRPWPALQQALTERGLFPRSRPFD